MKIKKISKEKMEKIVEFLKENDNFIITSHINPDGDNIGSSIAMTRYLQNIGKKAFHFLDDSIPSNLEFILENNIIYKSEDINRILEENNIDKYNLIVLDCGTKSRININKDIIENANKLICIDHHKSNDNFGNFNMVIPTLSSTCELVYSLFENININAVDEDIATAIYTGLSTDTGNFKFDSVTYETFNLASKLLRKGARMQEVVVSIYQNDVFNFMKLKADIILNHTKIIEDICIMFISTELVNKYNILMKDTEGLANLSVDIKGVNIGIVLRQHDESITRCSLRSKSDFDVSKVAEELGGGGHKKAAGVKMKNKSMEEIQDKILKTIKKFK